MTDYFNKLPTNDVQLINHVNNAKISHVELATHPEEQRQFNYINGDGYYNIICSVPRGSHREL